MDVIVSMDIVVFMCYTVKTLHMLIIFIPIQIRNYYYFFLGTIIIPILWMRKVRQK